MKLRTRVFDLEQQNRILSVLFQQRVKMSPVPVSQVGRRPAEPAAGPGWTHVSGAALIQALDSGKSAPV